MKIAYQGRAGLDVIVTGEDFQQLMQSNQATAAAHELRTNGNLARVVLRARDNRILFGADTVAAHVILGKADVPATFVNCTEHESLALRTADSSRIFLGRVVAGRAVDALLLAVEQGVLADRRDATHAGQPSSRATARKVVSDLIGIKPERLKRLELSQRAKEPAEPGAPWELNTYGMPCSDKLKTAAAAIREGLLGAALLCAQAQKRLRSIETEGLHSGAWERAYQSCHASSMLLRSMLPHALCPYCKDVKKCRQTCGGCFGSGYVNEASFAATQPEYVKHRVVSLHGRMVDMDTLKPWQAPVETNESYTVLDEADPEYEDEHEPPREWGA